MCQLRKKTPFELCCEEHLAKGDQKFTYIFQDLEFTIQVKSLWTFILEYANIKNRPEEIKAVLSALKDIRDEDILNSFVRISPTMGDLLSGSHPRFTVYMEDKVLVVIANDSFTPNENHPITCALYDSLPTELRMTKTLLENSFNTLLENPALITEKSAAALKEEAYIQKNLKVLEKLFNSMMYRIHFKANEKYGPYGETYPTLYIGFDDMSAYRYSIRLKEGKKYEDSTDPVVATYGSLKELLSDGWKLD